MRPVAGPEGRAALPVAALRSSAVLALALFAAWWTLVTGVVAALFAVAWFGRWTSAAAAAGGVLCLVVAARVVYRAWPSRGREPRPTPLPVAAAPGLVATVTEVCRASGQGLPLLVIVPEANAYAGRLPAVVPGTGRDMIALGLGLVAILDVPTFRTVLAHELGHHRPGKLALGPWVYRLRGALVRSLPRSREGHVLALPFRWYASRFLALSSVVSRQQEFDADAHAAHLVSAAHTAEALRRVHELAPRWDRYWRDEVVPLLEAGFVPPLLEGFQHYCRWAAALSPADQAPDDPHDSHPPLADRLAALGDPAPPLPGEPLGGLVDDLPALERAAVESTLAGAARLRVLDQPQRPAPGEVVLVHVCWTDVARRVWLPRYAAEVATWGSRLGINTLHRVPALLAHPEELSALFAARGPRVLSPLATRRLHLDRLAQALTVAMAGSGWLAEALPGLPLTLVRGEERVEPHAAIRTATAEAWPGQLLRWLDPQNCTPTDNVPP